MEGVTSPCSLLFVCFLLRITKIYIYLEQFLSAPLSLSLSALASHLQVYETFSSDFGDSAMSRLELSSKYII